jgi:hypothetical protein
MGITATKCIDGKKHNWDPLTSDGNNKFMWCRRCGSMTEFTRRWYEEPWKRCKNPNGTYYIEIPKMLLRKKK